MVAGRAFCSWLSGKLLTVNWAACSCCIGQADCEGPLSTPLSPVRKTSDYLNELSRAIIEIAKERTTGDRPRIPSCLQPLRQVGQHPETQL